MLDLMLQPTAVQFLAILGMAIALTASCVIDLQQKILPDEFTLFVFILGVVLAFTDPIRIDGWRDALCGGLIGLFGSLAFREIIFRIKKIEAMGLGDVKLFGAAGVWVGMEGVISVALVGSVVTILVVFAASLWKNKGKVDFSAEIPFGPGIAFGFLFTVLFGPAAYLAASFL